MAHKMLMFLVLNFIVIGQALAQNNSSLVVGTYPKKRGVMAVARNNNLVHYNNSYTGLDTIPLPPGTYKIAVQIEGYKSDVKIASIVDGKTKTLIFILKETTAVFGGVSYPIKYDIFVDEQQTWPLVFGAEINFWNNIWLGGFYLADTYMQSKDYQFQQVGGNLKYRYSLSRFDFSAGLIYGQEKFVGLIPVYTRKENKFRWMFSAEYGL